MTRGIIIAGNESALLGAIETEAARRAEQYTLALIPDRLSGSTATPSAAALPGRIALDWNPGSPISARTLVIAAENRIEHIDEAILVCDPPLIHHTASDLRLSDVEMLVNDQIKGWFFLVKELTAIFKKRGEGTLALVYPEGSGKDDTSDFLGPAALAVFRSFTHSLLTTAAGEPYLTLGFTGSESGDEAGFAAFITKQLEEPGRRNNGKLYKYGKLGIFR